MESILQSQVFFFISSIGFIILFILLSILLIYAIRGFRTFSRILNKAEKDIGRIGETTKTILEEVRDSTVFRLLVGKRRKRKGLTSELDN